MARSVGVCHPGANSEGPHEFSSGDSSALRPQNDSSNRGGGSMKPRVLVFTLPLLFFVVVFLSSCGGDGFNAEVEGNLSANLRIGEASVSANISADAPASQWHNLLNSKV